MKNAFFLRNYWLFEIKEDDESQSLYIDKTFRSIKSRLLIKWNMVMGRSNQLALILSVLCIYLYLEIFRICPYQTNAECSQLFLKVRLPKLMIMSTLSNLCQITINMLALRNDISAFWSRFVNAFIIFQQLFNGHEFSTQNYQLLFQVFHTIFLVTTFIIVQTILALKRLIKRWGYFKIVISILILLLAVHIYITRQLQKSCKHWKNGIFETQIIQDDQYCQIVEPEYCVFDYLDGYFDATRLYDCTLHVCDSNQNIQTWMNVLNLTHQPKYLIFPDITKLSHDIRMMNYNKFQYQFLKHTMPSNNSNQAIQSEVYLDLSNLVYNINIKYNQTLVEEKKLLQKDKKSPKNIISIWVDAVSRARFMKKLQKSVKWFEQNHNEKYKAFQSLRYLGVDDHTTPVYFAYMFGEVFRSSSNYSTHEKWSMKGGYEPPNQEPLINIQQQISNQGYIVGRAGQQCGTSAAELDPSLIGVLNEPYADHEFIVTSCDPNFRNPESPYGFFKGPYSIIRKCLYNKEVNNYVFDYAKQFLNTYSDEKKYLELYILDGHEGTGDAIGYLDDPLLDFLQWLTINNILEDSVIMLQSDHGLHMQGQYYMMGLEQYFIEISLPGFFAIMDKSLFREESHYINYQENQQKLLTVFEVHYFMKYLLDGSESENSIISSSIKDKRNCSDTPKPIEQLCPCI